MKYFFSNKTEEEIEQRVLAEIRQVLEKYNIIEPEPMARAKRKTNKKYRR